MARQRARDAFARVGTAAVEPVPADADENASIPASRKAGKSRRRAGRPAGPARVSLTVRILAATDDRLTAAVELTGQSPQYIVDSALAAWFDSLGIPGSARGSTSPGLPPGSPAE
jgi:hypothetical protein